MEVERRGRYFSFVLIRQISEDLELVLIGTGLIKYIFGVNKAQTTLNRFIVQLMLI